MAITVDNLKVIIRGTYLGEQFQNIQWYRITGAAFLTATPLGVAEAYWNDIKTAWRALMPNATQLLTESIFVSEDGLAGQYAEFPIPPGEQQGTRSISSGNLFMPPYSAIGIRLTVGSRVTRPGQKRLVGLQEDDNVAGTLLPATLTLAQALAPKFAAGITLGAPVATGVMNPEIVRIDPTTKLVTVRQDVTGFLVNTDLTTQNSRKFGRGA